MSPTNDPEENQYKNATKAVVDDAMRMDVLGPKVVEVIENYTPANEKIAALTLKSIKNDGNLRKEVVAIINAHLTTRKGKGIEKVGWQITAAVIVLLVGAIGGWLLSR